MKPATALGLLLLLFFPLKAAADVSVESPLAIKQRALDTLRAISTGDKKLQGQLHRATELLGRSLSHHGRSLFLDGWRIAPPPAGEKVFDGERDAIEILLHALDRNDAPPPIAAVVAQAVGDLVAADRSIATLSVETARRLRAVEPAAADAKKVTAASRELQRALGERNPARAVDRLASAWRLSQSAVDDQGLSIADFADAPDPFSPSTAHIVTATFVSLQRENGEQREDGERRRVVLELVEVVRDASGAIVRRLRTEQAVPGMGNQARVTLSSAWDGRDGVGNKVTDGSYSYLAFGRLKARPGRHEADEMAFPVIGTVLLDGTAPQITAQLNPPPNANGWNHETVTVTYAATDLLSGVVSVTPAAVVADEGEAQVVAGQASDAAGNVATVSVFVNLDRTPPSIQSTVTPATNAAGWHHGPVSVGFAVGDALSGVASAPAPVAVLTDGMHEVTGRVTDRAGNAAETTVAIQLDHVPPVVAITSPADSVSVAEANLVVTGTVMDAASGVENAACNGSPATLTGTSFSCGVTLHEGANDIVVAAGDVAGNVGSRVVHVTFAPPQDEDEDTDGVPSSVEDLAPHGGDGNGDDVPDGEQAHVVSLPNGEDGRYVTLEFLPGTAPAMVKAVANPSPADAPSSAGFPLGFFDFRVAGLTPGGTLTMTMYLPEGVGLSTYYRFGPTPDNPAPHWYDFAFDGATGAEMRAGRIFLHFVDGGRGDDDLVANGQIADPGGPSNGPCPLLHDPKVSLAPGQSYNCQLPPFGTGSYTWTLTNTADGTPSVLPPGLALVQDSGQFSIQGTVADDAYLISSRVALRVTGVLGSPIEEVTEVSFNVETPIKVWTQNTILRPEHVIDALEDIPHGTIVELLTFFIFGLPVGPSPGLGVEAVLAADEIYHHTVKNTASDNRQRAHSIINRAAPFDIVGLQEVFNDDDLDLITQQAHGHFVLPGPAEEGPQVFPPALPRGSAGLAVLVKKGLSLPQREQVDRLIHLSAKFEDCNPATDDCLANKGFTFDIVHLGPNPNHYIYVINSHAQSNGDPEEPPDPENPEARRAQFQQIKDFMDRFADRRHPVLIMGDLNVEADDTIEHRTMRRTLGVGEHDDLFKELHPDLVTYDIDRNAYARNWFPGSPRARLDYMLVRQGTRYRLDADYLTLADEAVQTSMCEAEHWIPNSEAPDLQCYLSDHFGIKGQLKLAEDLPYVHILSPEDGATVLQGEQVRLSAFAGNPLRHRADLFSETAWASDVEGSLGSRAQMTWRPYAVGAQTISASIVDFDGFAASSAITVFVRADTDRDGIADDDEVNGGTDPLNPDTDGDGLEDGAEVHTHGTDPLNRDTDGDGLDDGSEVRAGSSPLIADTDRDGLTDAFEVANQTNPASRDSDGDGVWDGPEVILNSDPISAARKPTAVPDGTLFTQTLGFLAIVDPVRGLVGHVGTPAGGLGFGLAFDGQRRLLVSAITGLVIVDPLTGVATPIAPFRTAGGETVNVINLALDAASGDFYGIEEGPAPNFLPTGQLLQIDPATAIVTRLGLAAEPIHALAFDPSGRLLVALAGADGLDRLVEMDRATGAALQQIGAIGFQPVFGLAVDWSGALFGSAVRPSGYQSDLLTVNTATGTGTSIAGFGQALFDLAFYVSAAPRFGPIEDFASDADPSQPGFASSVFVHSALPGGIVNQSGFPTPTPYPSTPFGYFLIRSTEDTVTFSLNPGESIDRARVRANGRFGGARVRFVGTGDTKTMTAIGQTGWIVLEAASTGLGDLGVPLGDILRIELSGGEGLVDDLEVHIHH